MKATQFIVMAAAVGTLAGCSTPGEMRNKPPALETSSAKPSKAVAGCIADQFEKAFKNGINTRPTAAGYSVWKEEDVGIAGKSTNLLVDIDDVGTGSKTKLFLYAVMGGAADKATRITSDCQ